MMTTCHACGEPFLPGTLRCQNCGTDLSPLASTGTRPSPPQQTGSPAAAERYCDPNLIVHGFEGCGYRGPMLNDLCPMCGNLWAKEDSSSPLAGTPVPDPSAPIPSQQTIPREPDGLPAAAPFSPPTQPRTPPTTPAAAASARVVTPVAVPPPARGVSPRLVVEGSQTVIYNMAGQLNHVSEIPFDTDQISIGHRDIENGHFPDIDLVSFRRFDPHLSRRHAVFLREGGRHFIHVLSPANSTTLNGTDTLLGENQKHELRPGDRIFFSDSIVIRFEQ